MRIYSLIKLLKSYYHRITKPGVEYARFLGMSVGENCRIFTSTFGSEPWLISIGNKVTITSGVRFLTHDGSTWLINDENGRRELFRRIIVGNNVFIGINSIIMPGVKIDDNVIIAAGSIVTKSIPTGVIVGGNPAKIIGDYNKYKTKAMNEYISTKDMDFKMGYRERIEKIVDNTFKDYMINKPLNQ